MLDQWTMLRVAVSKAEDVVCSSVESMRRPSKDEFSVSSRLILAYSVEAEPEDSAEAKLELAFSDGVDSSSFISVVGSLSAGSEGELLDASIAC